MWFLKWLTGGGIASIGKELRSAYEAKLSAKNDAERIEADRLIATLEADAAARAVKMESPLGRLPLFIAEMSASLYLAAVLIDSIWPSDWLNPLELPEWFKPQYAAALASVLGIGAAERTAKFFRGRS